MLRILAITLILIIQGCALATESEQNAEYENLADLDSVEGCYQNLGEHSSGSTDRYLSQILWPGGEIQHNLIKYIEVSLVSDKSVLAVGINEGKPIVESEFVDGQHFELESGKIKVTNKLFSSLAYPSGNPFIGVGHTSVTLGIDKSGDGKSTESSTFAGTAFLFIPVAGHVSDSVRFLRVGDSCIRS